MVAQQSTEKIQKGRYRHYKGGEYFVIDQATHSETGERFVVYRALYGDQGLWIRPYTMFFETVVINGQAVPRFAWLGDETSDSSTTLGRLDQ
ncbi:hypothetical protein AXX12_10490 [Anaerosporomusa subterranea]|uniref:DUF1653 domain-containing protein n=1 Tax=Anaerosporomusa subterranea TaxID=1794912 RepID=A0A154BNT2_ANASB|nr:DUF1653 domain-containing protein [Anaerosporomusa subterranea]KYZ75634.1 hypothetical protein AXX12_10490 [Anaerosporomusa subterranea]